MVAIMLWLDTIADEAASLLEEDRDIAAATLLKTLEVLEVTVAIEMVMSIGIYPPPVDVVFAKIEEKKAWVKRRSPGTGGGSASVGILNLPNVHVPKNMPTMD